MPLRKWAKKHFQKKDSDEEVESENEIAPPPVQIYRSDTLGITPLQIPDSGSKFEKSDIVESSSRTPSPSPKSPKLKPLSKLGVRHHRSSSQTSLPDWTPPDDADPYAERDWEARATTLAKIRPVSLSVSQDDLADLAKLSVKDEGAPAGPAFSSADGRLSPEPSSAVAPIAIVDGMSSDEALQEAIALHEAGGLSFKGCNPNNRTGKGYSIV